MENVNAGIIIISRELIVFDFDSIQNIFRIFREGSTPELKVQVTVLL
jgi:hypothetical protein